MELYYTFSNTHTVISAEKAVLAAGLPVKVRPLPPSIKAGCGIILCIDSSLKNALEGTLKKHSIPFAAVYSKHDNLFEFLHD